MANYNYSIVGKELSIKSRPEGNEQINSREPVFRLSSGVPFNYSQKGGLPIMSGYSIGFYAGYLLAGCIVGLFPLIVGIVKKCAPAGIILLIVCGLVASVQPVLSFVISIVSGIILCCIHKKE